MFLISLILSLAIIYKPKEDSVLFQKDKKDWSGTSLNRPSVSSKISNKNCYKKDNKIACIHAINQSLKELGMSLDKDGGFSNKRYSEKRDLSSWENSFIKLDYDKILIDLEKLYKKDNIEYHYGLIINGYLSIKKDPFTYIIPKEKYTLSQGKFQVGEEFFLSRSKKTKQYYFKYIAEDSDLYIMGLRQGDVLKKINDLVLNKETKLDEIFKQIDHKIWNISAERNGIVSHFSIVKNSKKLNLETYKIINNKIGYLKFKKFYNSLCKDVEEDLINLNKKNIKDLIIDLRYNGGGVLDEAECLANLLLPKYRLIYLAQNLNKQVIDVSVVKKDPIYLGNLYILINSNSASASEVLAGALKYNDRAILIGQRTYGKGVYQECQDWSENKKFLYCETEGLFLNPNEKSPQLIGIVPSIEILIDNELQSRQEDIYYNPIKNPNISKEKPQKIIDLSEKIHIDAELFFAIDFIEKYQSKISNIPN